MGLTSAAGAWLAACLLGPMRPSAAAGASPAGIVQVAARVGSQVLVVDKATQRLFVYDYDDGVGRVVESMPCTTGKLPGDKRREGDLRTPVGVYSFVRRMPGSALPPLYGAGALVMDYPNAFDLLDGKTGSGIWLHGVESDDRASVPNDTRGCVAVRNGDFQRLARIVTLDETPILIVERLEPLAPEDAARAASDMRQWVEGWRSAWEARDMDRYMSHYAVDFFADGRNRAAWERQKRDLAVSEPARLVGIDDLTILRDRDRWWVRFRQEYATPRHRDVGMKTLLVRGAGPQDWQVVHESWRPLELPFQLIHPETLEAPMSAALLAAVAPDAAPEAAVAALDRSALPPPEAPSAPEPAASEAQAPAAPAIEPPAVPRAWRARLDPARTTHRLHELFRPHVQSQGDATLLVQVQLLNLRATSVRTGALIVTPPHADGVPAQPLPPEPFSLKQGKLIALTLPREDGTQRVRIVVLDDAGRVVLDQDVVIEAVSAQ
jgi:murein L,D-transpeptidase YafK